MISFILIGRNEDKTIDMTIQSIYTYVDYNNIVNYEIIYVDSKSTDKSINIVKNYSFIRIFEITGDINAAIARNIGAKEAKGDVFIFLDSDMEIQKEFHKEAFDENNKLTYPFISGQLQNIFYNEEWKEVDQNILFPNLTKDEFHSTTGGYFIIEKELWLSVNGMKTRFKRAEDLDLGLRLAKRGTLLLRKNELFVNHHTVDYQNESRMWKMLFNGSFLYSTSLLYREHILNKFNYKFLVRQEYTMVLLFICLLLSFIYPLSLFIYIVAILLRSILQAKVKGNSSFFGRFTFLFIKDIMTIVGFFSFFPSNKEINYKKVVS